MFLRTEQEKNKNMVGPGEDAEDKSKAAREEVSIIGIYVSYEV